MGKNKKKEKRFTDATPTAAEAATGLAAAINASALAARGQARTEKFEFERKVAELNRAVQGAGPGEGLLGALTEVNGDEDSHGTRGNTRQAGRQSRNPASPHGRAYRDANFFGDRNVQHRC